MSNYVALNDKSYDIIYLICLLTHTLYIFYTLNDL